MNDREIVELFLKRSETAIRETESKYGRYLETIAMRILGDESDAAEVVSDTCLAAWNAIPPHEPENLAAFLGKLARQTAIKRWRKRGAQKRGGETTLALEELGECVPSRESPEREVEARELREAVGAFVSALPDTERRVFLCRYWHLDPINDICRRFGFSQSRVKSMLARTRKKLRKHLLEEGIIDEG